MLFYEGPVSGNPWTYGISTESSSDEDAALAHREKVNCGLRINAQDHKCISIASLVL